MDLKVLFARNMYWKKWVSSHKYVVKVAEYYAIYVFFYSLTTVVLQWEFAIKPCFYILRKFFSFFCSILSL